MRRSGSSRGRGTSGDFGWQASEAFTKGARGFAGTPSAQSKIRRPEEHGRCREEAIEKIDSVGVAHRSRESGLATRVPGIIVAAARKRAQLPAAQRHRTAG